MSIAIAASQQQHQLTARTVTSSASSINNQRNSNIHDFANPSTSNNLKNSIIQSASKVASTNYCKDSLNDASTINQDLNSKHVIKVSRKDLRPLSEEELSKRTKKSE